MKIELAGCPRWIPLAGLALGLIAVVASSGAAGRRSQVPSLAILVTHVTGEIVATFEPAGTRAELSESSVPRPLRRLQQLPEGAEIRLPPDSELGLVCANDRYLHLQGSASDGSPRIWVVRRSNCDGGTPLSPGAFKSLQPSLGRLVQIGKVHALERLTRSDLLDPLVPVVIHPRNTSLLEGRPRIAWTATPGAIEYEVLTVGAVAFRFQLDAAEVDCPTDPLGSERPVCSIPWPTDHPELPADEDVFLTVGSRSGLARPLRTDDAQPNRIRRLTRETAEEVLSRIREIHRLPLDAASQHLLAGRIYAQADLFADAIRAYRSMPEPQPPELWVTVGDLYLETDLPAMAYESYQRALQCLGPRRWRDREQLAVEAAAEQGLGRVHFAVRNYPSAAKHFRVAAARYQQLEVPSRAQAVAAQAAQAEARSAPAQLPMP